MINSTARRRWLVALAFVVAFAIPWIHGPAEEFVYDAAQYWGGVSALLEGRGPVVPGGLATRGIFTILAFLPPALVTSMIGPDSAIWTVLAWNSLLGAAASTFLIPRVAGLFSGNPRSRPSTSQVWVSAILGSFVLSGFARYPLVDVSSASLAVLGFYLLAIGRGWRLFSVAGVVLMIAVNLRPALIAPVALAVAVLLIVRARPIAIAALAAALAAIPQVVFNVAKWELWSPVPRETVALSAVQAAPAPYALRYDTVAFADQAPQQWYCDRDYAALLIEDELPRNQLDVIASAINHLPESLWFLVRKAAASLHWSLSTPYGNPPDSEMGAMSILIVGVSAVGVCALVLRAIRLRSHRGPFATALAFLAFWVGALATVVFSTPETRFALPLVIVGLVGVVAWLPEFVPLRAPSRSCLIAATVAVLLSVGLFASGKEALTHSMAPGPLSDAAECARK